LSNKKQQLLRLLERVELRWKLPHAEPSLNLLDAGMLAVLQRRLGVRDAESTVKALHQAFPDWNELRVCQPQEIAPHLKVRQESAARRVALDVREYLNELYWKNHGFDLEFMRADPVGAARFAGSLEWIGTHVGHWMLALAEPNAVPVTQAMVRVLDRLGLSERIGSLKKARPIIEQIAPKGGEVDFAVRLGEIADRWCLAARPLCQECPLVSDCAHGRRVYREWKLQQARMEAQKRRDLARQEVLRKKEEQRLAREAARLRKKQEADAKKLARDQAALARAKALARAGGRPATAAVKPAGSKQPKARPQGVKPGAKPGAGHAPPVGHKTAAGGHKSPAGARSR
jgi:endonuclease III